MKNPDEIKVSIILNDFLKNPFYYLKNVNKIGEQILKLNIEEIYTLHKIASDVIYNPDKNDPSKYNICFNICVMCTNLLPSFVEYAEELENCKK